MVESSTDVVQRQKMTVTRQAELRGMTDVAVSDVCDGQLHIESTLRLHIDSARFTTESGVIHGCVCWHRTLSVDWLLERTVSKGMNGWTGVSFDTN